MSIIAAEEALNTPRSTANTQSIQLAPIERAIEYNLQAGFVREYSQYRGVYWSAHPRKSSNLSVRVWPQTNKDVIHIMIFDESPANSNNPSRGLEIKSWTTKVMMTGEDWEWKERLAAKAGVALVQAKKQPACPSCRENLVVRETHEENGGKQFFGCPRYPDCTGSLSIGSFEAERSRPPAQIPAPLPATSQQVAASSS
jgi:hypothetical protein